MPPTRWLPCSGVQQCQRRCNLPRQVHIEETLPENAVGKVAKPVLRERRQGPERPPDRPHAPGPFGINIFTAERAVVVRAADVPAEPATRTIAFQHH